MYKLNISSTVISSLGEIDVTDKDRTFGQINGEYLLSEYSTLKCELENSLKFTNCIEERVPTMIFLYSLRFLQEATIRKLKKCSITGMEDVEYVHRYVKSMLFGKNKETNPYVLQYVYERCNQIFQFYDLAYNGLLGDFLEMPNIYDMPDCGIWTEQLYKDLKSDYELIKELCWYKPF